MNRINVGRVIGGGLAAGLVIAVVDFLVEGLWLGHAWQAIARVHNYHGNQAAVGAYFTIINFVEGVIILWVYAAMRPRLGAGPRTAVIAAVTVWAAIFLMDTGDFVVGMIPGRVHFIGVAGWLVGSVAGALVGGMLYKEEEGAGAAGAKAA